MSWWIFVLQNRRYSSDLPQGGLELASYLVLTHTSGTDFNRGLEWASLESFAGLKTLEVIFVMFTIIFSRIASGSAKFVKISSLEN